MLGHSRLQARTSTADDNAQAAGETHPEFKLTTPDNTA